MIGTQLEAGRQLKQILILAEISTNERRGGGNLCPKPEDPKPEDVKTFFTKYILPQSGIFYRTRSASFFYIHSRSFPFLKKIFYINIL